MKRKQLILWGAALLSAAIGLDVSVGKDAPPISKKTPNQPVENKDSANAEIAKSKKGEIVNSKPEADSGAKESVQPVDTKPSADEEAIRLTGDTYVKAYCDGDAKSIAESFTPDAEYVDEKGDTYHGRDEIEAAMKALFAENAGCQIALDIETIRIISPGVAVEDGATKFVATEGADPIYSRYTAIHVKTNGKWLAASVREHAPKDRRQHRAQLNQLAWLNGEWVDESDDSLVLFSCEAVDGGNFLVRNYEIRVGGRPDATGTQRIGWDPLTGKVRAWIFDSEGGYGEGFWHHDGDCWMLKSTGVTADGLPVSGTTTYTYVNENTMTWQSVDREVAGVALPDSETVTIVRRAPLPEIVAEPPLSTSN